MTDSKAWDLDPLCLCAYLDPQSNEVCSRCNKGWRQLHAGRSVPSPCASSGGKESEETS